MLARFSFIAMLALGLIACDSPTDSGSDSANDKPTYLVAYGRSPTWSPVSRRIAYVVESPNDSTGIGIYVVDADGGDPVNLIQYYDNDRISSPSWSPDGQRIAYTYWCWGESKPEDFCGTYIHVVDADDSNFTNLPHTLSYDLSDWDSAWYALYDVREYDPVWSPNGQRIAFSSGHHGAPSDIYVVDVDGGDPINLTPPNLTPSNSLPSWSPDGQRIAFSSGRNGGPSDIYVMDADGGNPINLTLSDNAREYDPVWSPDGQHIAFSSFAYAPDVYLTGGGDLCVMDADGSAPITLETNSIINLFGWSPDSQRIAFTVWRGGLYVVDADGGDPIRIDQEGRYDDYPRSDRGNPSPSWSPDGQHIAYGADNHGIYVIPVP